MIVEVEQIPEFEGFVGPRIWIIANEFQEPYASLRAAQAQWIEGFLESGRVLPSPGSYGKAVTSQEQVVPQYNATVLF